MGGGGGGGPSLTPGDLERLIETAKRSMAAASGKCNAFLSFVEEDLEEVNLLRGQAKNESSDIEFNDWSLKEPYNSKKAEYIKRGIRERIRQSSKTIVYLSDRTANSSWVDWEIRESIALGKEVIGTHKGASPPTTLPKAIIENRVRIVPWNQLAQAIRKRP